MSILVIGAGYLGIAAASYVENLGEDVCLMDTGDKQGGSAASMGLLRESWLTGSGMDDLRPSWWSESHRVASLRVAREVFLAVPRWFTGDAEGEVLVAQPITEIRKAYPVINHDAEAVVGYEDGAEVIYDGGKRSRKYDAVVIATGYGTNALLKRSGFDPLGVFARTGAYLPIDSDYYQDPSIAEVRAGARIYHVEDMVGPTYEGGVAIGDLYDFCNERNLVALPRTEGLYTFGEDGRLTVKKVASRVLVMVGGGRIGLALAGGAALEAHKILKFSMGAYK